jgi:hypothetical protein
MGEKCLESLSGVKKCSRKPTSIFTFKVKRMSRTKVLGDAAKVGKLFFPSSPVLPVNKLECSVPGKIFQPCLINILVYSLQMLPVNKLECFVPGKTLVGASEPRE